MPRKDPYKNVKLYEELNNKGLNDFEIVRVVSQEAKRINEHAMLNEKELFGSGRKKINFSQQI